MLLVIQMIPMVYVQMLLHLLCYMQAMIYKKKYIYIL